MFVVKFPVIVVVVYVATSLVNKDEYKTSVSNIMNAHWLLNKLP